MTYAELVNFIRLQISEEVEAFYLDGNLRQYIIAGASRFASRTRCVLEKQTITIVPGTGTYNLNFDPIKERSIVYQPSGEESNLFPFIPVSYQDWQRLKSTRKDSLCYVDNQNKQIQVSTELEAGSLYLEFSAKVVGANIATYFDNDRIPPQYHEAIADYAIFLCYKKDREFQLASLALQGYRSVEEDAIIRVAEEEVNPVHFDFNIDNPNPHRDNLGYQDMVEI